VFQIARAQRRRWAPAFAGATIKSHCSEVP
jgi:hypothetical protein